MEVDIENAWGFSGSGYLVFPLSGGYATWKEVDGLTGGKRTLALRYSNGSTQVRTARLNVNGSRFTVQFKPTGAWNDYRCAEISVELRPGADNTITLESTWTGTGYVDELQIY